MFSRLGEKDILANSYKQIQKAKQNEKMKMSQMKEQEKSPGGKKATNETEISNLPEKDAH